MRTEVAVNSLADCVGEPACDLSVVLPCLDEGATVASCVADAGRGIARLGVVGEVVVADNTSADDSAILAREAGARVVQVPARGYGAALRAGIAAARGTYVLLADADATYDLADLSRFWERLEAGDDLVIGNRFAGHIQPGAMPFWNRRVGNPLLSGLARALFSVPVGDFHCGLRAFRRDAILALQLRTNGMEFATEMIVRAARANLVISETPTTLRASRPGRPSHLRPIRDGARHVAVIARLRLEPDMSSSPCEVSP